MKIPTTILAKSSSWSLLLSVLAATACAGQDNQDAEREKQLKDSLKGAKGVKVHTNRVRPITVRVRLGERPLATKVRVHQTTLRGSFAEPSVHVPTDKQGALRRRGKNGHYTFTLDPQQTGYYGRVKGKLDFDDKSLDLTLIAHKALQLNCQLRGPTEALGGMRVALKGESGTRTATTNPDGNMMIDRLAPGKYTLTAFPTGYLSATVTLEVPRKQQAKPVLIRIPLEKPPATRPVFAKVFVVSGKKRVPAPDGLVLRVGGDSFVVKKGELDLGKRPVGWDPTRTMDKGKGQYALARVEGLPLSDRPLAFLLHRKSPLLLRLVADGKPVVGAHVYLGADADKHRPPDAYPDDLTWLKKVPRLPEVKPGLYRGPVSAPGEEVEVGAVLKGFAPRREVVVVAEGVPSSLTLEQLFPIRGVVESAGEKPAGGASVVLVGPTGPIEEAYTGPEGSFAFRPVPRGNYTLFVIPSLSPLFNTGSRATRVPGWTQVRVNLPQKAPLKVRLTAKTQAASGTATVENAPKQIATYLKTPIRTLEKDTALRRKLLPEGYQGPLNRHVVVWPKGARLAPSQFVGAARIDAAGRFTLHVPPGKYSIGLLIPFRRQLFFLAREVEVGPKAKPLHLKLAKIK